MVQTPDGTPRAKARLVVQGFKDPDALDGSLQTSSPTALRTTRLSVLLYSQINNWPLFTADVSTAFLQGKGSDRNLWVLLPPDACQILGYPKGTRMKLKKSMYGLSDAPRLWWQEATRRLEECGFEKHPLDPCLFLSYAWTNNVKVLDGIICLHVDDMLGAGAKTKNGLHCFASREEKLKSAFKFRTWENKDKMDFHGAQITKEANGDIHLDMSEYIANVKPITLTKDRSKDPTQKVTDSERRQIRGLLGALSWAANQTASHASATISTLQGVSEPTVSTIQEANKTLRFMKSNSDVGVRAKPIATSMKDVRFVVMTDAAWGVRVDGTSQGGYLILAMHKDTLAGKSGSYSVIDWRSWKLPRVSRSSLSSEAQAACGGVDALEFVKTFISLCEDNRRNPMADLTMQQLGPSALIIDAKALFDAAQKEHLHNFEDKRTGIEVMVLKQRTAASGTTWKWVSSERQYADGLTKIQARQLLADRLRNATIVLKHDPNFVAMKKQMKEERATNTKIGATQRPKRPANVNLVEPAISSTPSRLQPSLSSSLVSSCEKECQYIDLCQHRRMDKSPRGQHRRGRKPNVASRASPSQGRDWVAERRGPAYGALSPKARRSSPPPRSSSPSPDWDGDEAPARLVSKSRSPEKPGHPWTRAKSEAPVRHATSKAEPRRLLIATSKAEPRRRSAPPPRDPREPFYEPPRERGSAHEPPAFSKPEAQAFHQDFKHFVKNYLPRYRKRYES